MKNLYIHYRQAHSKIIRNELADQNAKAATSRITNEE